ncbi:ATP NAD kinase [Coniochaeta sp. 2T2.1]|nr:ATP NAD kinase [Coniochaeta sp. 2T2.1]
MERVTSQDSPGYGGDGHSSASDEDGNAVEVMFDPSSPYRRKSSLVTSDATPMLRRNQTTKTQCMVHQFLDSQRRAGRNARHPHHHHHHDNDHYPATIDEPAPGEEEEERERERHESVSKDFDATARRHKSAPVPGPAGENPSVAVDATSERGLDRVIDPKGSSESSRSRPQSPGSKTKAAAAADGNGGNGVLRGAMSASPLEEGAEDEVDPETEGEIGQVDEKHWTSDIAALRKPHTLDDTPVAGTPPRQPQEDELRSRLLTKKQLSEMAWGVRELSRRLGSVRLKFRARNIFLLTKIYDLDLIPKTRELAAWLLSPERKVRYVVYVERDLRENKKFDARGLVEELNGLYKEAGEERDGEDLGRRLRCWDENMCRTRPHTFDFVITLGGDGTVLFASWLFQRIVPPVLSFSLGSLGFLTKFDFEQYQSTLTRAFNDGVTVSLRLRFEGTIMRSQRRKIEGATDEDEAERHSQRDLVEELVGEEMDDEHTHRPTGTYEILNEIVIDRGPNPTMSYTEIFGDDEHFTSVLADGVCVSTPTGSTAYNLAAGGSLCHPENPVMLVTSICAHTLSFRPIILPDTIVLRIGVPYDARTGSWASFDGRERTELHTGDYVTISASRYPFASVQAPGRRSEEWINSISGKLGWNTRQKQKAFKEWEK